MTIIKPARLTNIRTSIRRITNPIIDSRFVPESIRSKIYSKRIEKDMKTMREMLESATPDELAERGLRKIDETRVLFGELSPELEKAERELKAFQQVRKASGTVVVVAQNEQKTKSNASEYTKNINVNLKKSLTEMLNTLPWTDARNALIRKIEAMDNVKLNELYRAHPELFQVYYDIDSPDVYGGGWNGYDVEDEGLYGFYDLINEYESRYGVKL